MGHKSFQAVTIDKELVEIRFPNGHFMGVVLKNALLDAGQFLVKIKRGGWYILGHEHQPFKTFEQAVAALQSYSTPKQVYEQTEGALSHSDGAVHLFLKRNKKFYCEETKQVKKMAFRRRKKLFKALHKAHALGGGICNI